mmetsp:Transcript_63335/g.87091  ORF Transcript_63335/g.87091 Transcript_63335/m.87091 type:complete len:155 (+) Transcript_63335:249-713(+)
MTGQMNGVTNAPTRQLTKNEKKRAKKKAEAKKKKILAEVQNGATLSENGHVPPPPPPEDDMAGVDVEYVSATTLQEDMDEFKAIFEKFASVEELTGKGKKDETSSKDDDPVEAAMAAAKAIEATATVPEDGDEEDGEKKMSRKARKKMSRLSVA